MRSIDVTIVDGSQAVTAFKAIRRFQPSAMLGPTLGLIRSSQPLHIDLAHCNDRLACFSSLLQLLDELDQLKISYNVEISDQIQEMGERPPEWLPRPGTKSDIAALLEIEKQRRRHRLAAAAPEPGRSASKRVGGLAETLRQRIGELFHERWVRLGLQGLLPEERDHVLLWELHAEVNDGGLDQYLFNSSGDHAEGTVGALERAGLASLAGVLRRTLAAVPGGWCVERVERCRRVAAMPDRWDVFGALSDAYHQAVAAEPPSDSLAESILAAYRREGLITEQHSTPDPGGDSG